ncbi:MAG: FAD-dependent oxidoreductase, partial [Planctomycetota bacterium]
KPKTGVFVCHCGRNIAGTVTIDDLLNELRTSDPDLVVMDHMFVCSEDGQNLIKDAIKDEGLDRLVVASCSPIHHGTIFTRCVKEAGLNPYMWEMANIREHCSWVHQDPELATKKAYAIIKGAINRVRAHNPIESIKVPMVQDVLVIGGGITGMHSAIELGDKGFKVALIEKGPNISPILNEVSAHENVDIFTMSEVLDFRGRPGEYFVTVRKQPRFIDEAKCTGCNDCVEPCPVELSSEFNHALGTRKAVYIPHQGAVPNKYTITKLGEPPCRDACPAHINVQGYVALIRSGKYQEALDLIRDKCALPSICGYVCPHFCEQVCNRKEFDSSAVSIKELKRYVADFALEQGTFQNNEEIKKSIAKKTGKKVAIIGSDTWWHACGGYSGVSAA